MKLTVGQYQQLYIIAKSEDDELDKSMQSVEVITGKSADDMPLNEFNKLSREIVAAINSQRLNTKPVSFLKSGKKLYQVNYKVGTLRAGQNAELQHWLKDKDWIQNMDKILASIVVPIKSYLWVKLPGKNQSEKHTREEQSELIMATKLAYYHRRGVNVNRYFMGNYSTTRRNCNDYFSYSGGISNAPGSEYSVRSLSGEFTQ